MTSTPASTPSAMCLLLDVVDLYADLAEVYAAVRRQYRIDVTHEAEPYLSDHVQHQR